MKNQIVKKLSAIVLIAVLMLSVFTGCTGSGTGSVPVHSSVSDLAAKLTDQKTEIGTVPANLYFDNTQSMYGYLCDGKGESNFADVCPKIADIIMGFKKYTINKMTDKGGVLKWANTPNNSFDQFRQKTFYTYGSADFDIIDGRKSGPLRSLFVDNDSPVNFDELNVFITDLSEQGLENKTLADKINDIVLNAEDHSVALYCIESNFSGVTFYPVSNRVVNGEMETARAEYTGEKPFYVLVVGPTIEVVSICNEIDSTLTDSGYVEGRDFNSTRVLSKRGLKYSPITNAETAVFDNLYVDSNNKDTDYGKYQKGFTFENSNLNFDVKAVNYDQIYDNITQALPGLCFKYDKNISSVVKDTWGLASLNFALPLSALADGTAASADEVTYTLSKDSEHIKVYGYRALTDEEIVSAEAEITTSEDGEVSAIPSGTWEEISYYELFDMTDHYITAFDMEVLANGTVIERVSDYADNENLKLEEYPADKLALYTVDNENGALRFNIRMRNVDQLAEKYSMITFTFPVEASRVVSETTPSWIGDYNLQVKSSYGKKEAISRTLGLEDFYLRLVGRMTSATERKEFETYMTKTVTDVVINFALTETKSY